MRCPEPGHDISRFININLEHDRNNKMKKHSVLDTNVLLHNADAIASFADNVVVLPMTVIKEEGKSLYFMYAPKGINELPDDTGESARSTRLEGD